jgi:uncharacterized protein YjbI with pentapeptide repeats
MIGIQFDTANQFAMSFSFDHCILTNSTFYQTKLKQTKFKNCNLNEVDFTLADLSGSDFYKCDFAGAIFDQTNLEKADFRTSFNYSIHPETNKIKRSKHSQMELSGLLDKYDITIE